MIEKHTELSLLVEQVILGESEQLDELKASTLGSYMGKSAKSERKLAEPENEVFRQYYKKTSDMSPEDKEVEREKLMKTTSEKKYRDAKKKIDNRRKGFQQAIKKLDTGDFQESLIDQLSDAIEYLDEDQIQLVAEMVVELLEMEQLDELKKEPLGNYIKKAKDDYGTRRGEINAYELGSDSRKDAIKTAVKRRKGVDTAVDKLIKGQYQEEYIEEELSELISGVVLDEAVKVSKSSEEYYKFTHGKSPEQMSKSTGSGNFAFSTVPSKEHDVRKHDTHFVRANDYGEAKKKAIAHYKELGHNGEIHTLT